MTMGSRPGSRAAMTAYPLQTGVRSSVEKEAEMRDMGIGKMCQPGGQVTGRTDPKNLPQVHHTHTRRGRASAQPQSHQTNSMNFSPMAEIPRSF